MYKQRGLFLILFLAMGLTAHAQTRNGQPFDTGATMTQRAENAPEALDQMQGFLGQWDVALTTFPTDSTSYTAHGQAEITFMNRGHALMETFHTSDFDGQGHERNTATLFAYNGTQWNMGIVDSFTEFITMYDGGLEGTNWVFHNVLRRIGSSVLTHYRATITQPSDRDIRYTLETSTDYGQTWQKAMVKAYTKRMPRANFMAARDDFGNPAPNLPEEAREFDFLIGHYNAANNIRLPSGQNAQFPAETSATYTLNGHGIMEFSWYDIDPNLPDASTTIFRIYNRSMRRWECLYLTNRGNAMLHFGGRKEGDRIVLTNFVTHAADSPARYVFYNLDGPGYQWFAESSTDRGQTWTTNWTIDVTVKPAVSSKE